MGRIGCCPGAGGLWPPCEPGDCCIALLDNNEEKKRRKKKVFNFICLKVYKADNVFLLFLFCSLFLGDNRYFIHCFILLFSFTIKIIGFYAIIGLLFCCIVLIRAGDGKGLQTSLSG
jgi:hypothetical protein